MGIQPLRSVRRLILSVVILAYAPSQAQMVFVAAQDFGGRTGTGLFQAIDGTVIPLPTGLVEHNFPSLSRDNRFIVFSSPDGVTAPLQVPPSSDIYVFDRATAQTRRIVDNETIIFSPSEVDTAIPTSAELSPNNQLLAYGVKIVRRQGTANPRTTKELNIARSSDGIIVSNPTFGRGPVSDAFDAEFVGLSWDPGGGSFVTPTYVPVPSQLGGVQLPAIVRYAQDNGGNWVIVQQLSAPRYFDAQIPPGAEAHLYPSVSPSGAGLAYCSVFWPDALGGSQGVITSVIVANADGSNARVVTTLNPGFYPAGLNWSPDGTSLVLALAQQTFIGTGFLPSAHLPTAVVRRVSLNDGAITTLPGVDAGFFPMWRTLLAAAGSLDGVALQLASNAAGGFTLGATGVNPARSFFLQSASDLGSASGFGSAQAFSGAQLVDGIPLNLPTASRFFRLTPNP